MLFISTTTFVGFYYSQLLHDRPKHIRYLKNTLQLLEAEMMYSKKPLQEVFRILSIQSPTPLQSLFKNLEQRMDHNDNNEDFYIIWAEEISKMKKKTALSTSVQDILMQFGKTLGQHDLIQQQKQIVLTQTHLQRELENAEEQAKTYGNMARSLGILSGVFIVLLLI